MKNKHWKIAFWILLVSWVTGALLFMARVKGGFMTNYLSDLTFPAWFYIYIRGLSRSDNQPPGLLLVNAWLGKTPERAMVSIISVGIITEFKTFFLPNGIISGTFDYLDILAYSIGLLICYYFDRKKVINN